MKTSKIVLPLLASLLTAAGVSAASPACAPADAATRAALEELHRRDAEASRLSGPAARAAILALLTDDAVMIGPNSAPVVGRPAWGKALEQADASATDWTIDSYVESYPEIVVCGELAYEWGTITTVAHSAKSGRRVTQVGNSLRILRQSPAGIWLIHRAIFNTQSTS